MTSSCSMSTKSQTYRPMRDDLFEYADLSAKICIKPGLKIRGWLTHLINKPHVVQRLTDRSYLVGAAGYNATVHVGRNGVLLVSPQSGIAATHTLQAIRTITDLPITAVVYTHYHLDHVEGIHAVLDESRQRSVTQPAIWATDLTAGRIVKFGNKVPLPTNVIPGHEGEFQFEDIHVAVNTPRDNGHCVDNAIVHLKEEKIAQFDDMLEPECMPFPHFGPQEDLIAFEENLQLLHGMEWDFVNGGHGNIGGKADVRFYLDYFNDLRNKTGEVMERLSMTDFIVPTYSYMGSWMNYLKAASALVKEELRPKYGLYYGFEESVPTHVEMMLSVLISY